MEIYVCYIAQAAPDSFHQGILDNNKEFLGQFADSVCRADEVFKKWSVASLGRPIFVNGGFGCVCVPADKAVELPKIKGQLEELAGVCAIGVGTEIREAWTACELGMVNGGGKLLLYEPGMEQKLEDAEESSSSSSHDIGILKSEEHNSLKPDSEDSSKEVQDPEQSTPKPLQEQPPAQIEEEIPGGGAEGEPTQEPSPMQMIVDALAQVKQHAATIEKLKAADPRAYEAVKNIVSAMILMAQNMAQDTQPAQPEQAQQPQAPAGGAPSPAPAPETPAPTPVPAAKSEVDLAKSGRPGRYSTVPTTSQANIKRPTRKRGRGPRRRLPVGSVNKGKIKVKDPATGKSKWITAK